MGDTESICVCYIYKLLQGKRNSEKKPHFGYATIDHKKVDNKNGYDS